MLVSILRHTKEGNMTINEVRLDRLKHELMDIGWEYIYIEEIQEPAIEVEDFTERSWQWTEFQDKHK